MTGVLPVVAVEEPSSVTSLVHYKMTSPIIIADDTPSAMLAPVA